MRKEKKWSIRCWRCEVLTIHLNLAQHKNHKSLVSQPSCEERQSDSDMSSDSALFISPSLSLPLSEPLPAPSRSRCPKPNGDFSASLSGIAPLSHQTWPMTVFALFISEMAQTAASRAFVGLYPTGVEQDGLVNLNIPPRTQRKAEKAKGAFWLVFFFNMG